MRNYVRQILGVLLCLVFSIAAALVISSLVPVVRGPVHLDKPASDYSHEQLRDIFRQEALKANEPRTLMEVARGRGIVPQLLIWVLGVCLFRPRGVSGMAIWCVGLLGATAMGIFSLIQTIILAIGIGTTHYFTRRNSLKRKTEIEKLEKSGSE